MTVRVLGARPPPADPAPEAPRSDSSRGAARRFGCAPEAPRSDSSRAPPGVPGPPPKRSGPAALRYLPASRARYHWDEWDERPL
ncbi:hypothetical protein GCM10017687_76740 [Streptomyces echinatus]